jgi:peptide/nickel transport system substrate-binding protein
MRRPAGVRPSTNFVILSQAKHLLLACAVAAVCLSLTSCHRAPDPNTLTFLIESSPNSLDLRQGTDAQSERIGALIYDPLVHRDAQFNLQPWLATSWSRPDPLTWTFHLRSGVRFHDGHPLTSADVAWTIRSLSNGTLVTSKSGAFLGVTSIETPDALTLTLHTKAPDNSLAFNLSDGLFGVVEQGAGRDEGLHPVGTGPFRFVSQVQDKDVVVEANPAYWNGAPHIPRIRFEIIPDLITAALELEKGSADVASNVITNDEVHSLEGLPNIRVDRTPGTPVVYANFNTRDPILRDPRVRQAVAYAMDRPALIAALSHNEAKLADSFLPPSHWAHAPSSALAQYPHDPQKAIALLEAAGYHADKNGVRLRFTLKTSTDETIRVLAEAVQSQLAAVGIDLTIRPSEFGTFYSDITKGAFQMYILRWVGATNLDPDIFRYCFATSSFPPQGANRGFYANPEIDRLVAEAGASPERAVQLRDYIRIQQILSVDLPAIPMWNPADELVHSTRLTNVHPDADGSFSFLRTARLQ